jgi:hypothetical protein
MATPDQNVFADIDGHVEVPLARQIREQYGPSEFPLGQRGQSFPEFLDRIRRAATDSSRTSNAVGAALFAC